MINLGWGNSICVRDAFLETYHGNMIVFTRDRLATFDYPDREGDTELVEYTKKVIKRQTNEEYKHVLLTNGATGGVTISLRAYGQRGKEFCRTRNAPYYIRYPDMIKASGLLQINEDAFKSGFGEESEIVTLLDLPSNPLGKTTPLYWYPSIPTIIDGVYFSKVYMNTLIPMPEHDVMVGSYSKLTGLNGIRIGWIATNDSLLYERLKTLVISEYCGLSRASTDLLKSIVHDFDWDWFELRAKNKLNSNREEWSKLEKFFGDAPVGQVGMFYYAPMDARCKRLMEKSEISWTKGSELGTDNNFARFNLGQSCELIKEAVKTVLKNDKSK